VCACIHADFADRSLNLKSTAEFINTLPGTPLGKKESEEHISFMFTSDFKAGLLDALRSSKLKDLPQMQICTAYKNVVGGAFYCRQRFHLLITKHEHDEMLKNWFTQVSTFDSVYKNELKQLDGIDDAHSDRWNTVFEKTKHLFEEKITGDDIKIQWRLVPELFSVNPIDQNSYKDVICQRSYGSPVTLHGCPCSDK
jgi:hypothetical protein